jgi:hypothetical protein
LRSRVRNTPRRLRAGHLARYHGLTSIETGTFSTTAQTEPSGSEASSAPPQESAPSLEADRQDGFEGVFDPWDKYIVPDFPLDILPDPIRRFVETQAVAIGGDANALAMAALANFSAALDHRFALKLMRHGEWWAPPRLWVLLVGDPSRKKTPVINTALRALDAHQNRLRDSYEAQLASYEADLRSRGKNDGPEPPPPPKPPRLVVSDTTIEKLGEILAMHPRGLLVKRDEFSGWIGSMEKYGGSKGSAADRAFWLQAFDGGPYTIDRVARGEFRVANLSVSLIGGIQPARLAELHGLTSDGLLQRFIPVMMGPSEFPRDIPVDGPFDEYNRLTTRLIAAPPQRLSLSDPALEIMQDVRRHLHELEQAAGGLAEGFQAFIGKMAGLAGSLALILHMARDPHHGPSSPVPAGVVEAVRRLVVDFVLPHAFEFYRTAETVTDGDRVQRLASWIITSGQAQISSRDLTRNVWDFRGLSLLDINKRVSPLVAGGWLKPVEPGPISRSWAVAPEVAQQFQARAKTEEDRKARLADLMKSPRHVRGAQNDK